MSLKFSLVHRKDMTKGAPADRKLYYGLTRVSSRLDLENYAMPSPREALPAVATSSWCLKV